MLQDSDLKLLEIFINTQNKGLNELDPETLGIGLHTLEQYIHAIIQARYITEPYLELIISEVINGDKGTEELIEEIKLNVKKQGYDPKLAQTIIHILGLYVRTAAKTKEIVSPSLRYYIRRFLAKTLNCGEYAEKVEMVMSQIFPPDEKTENEGSILARRLIQEYQNRKIT